VVQHESATEADIIPLAQRRGIVLEGVQHSSRSRFGPPWFRYTILRVGAVILLTRLFRFRFTIGVCEFIWIQKS
jgi:hypothetical protein